MGWTWEECEAEKSDGLVVDNPQVGYGRLINGERVRRCGCRCPLQMGSRPEKGEKGNGGNGSD